MKYHGFSKEGEVAEMFGLKHSDFSRRKKQGKLLERVTTWAINNGIDLDDLLHGDSEATRQPQVKSEIVAPGQESAPEFDLREAYMDAEISQKQGQAVRMLLDIFESGDQKAVDAIYKNLEYFSSAAKRGATDRRKVTDPNWPAEKERRQGGAGPKAQQG